jgi:hypothetical protein
VVWGIFIKLIYGHPANPAYADAENPPALSQIEAILTAAPLETSAKASAKTSAILASFGQAAFVWDIATDAICWSDHAGAVFSDIPAVALSSGAGLAGLIEPDRSVRTDALRLSPPAHGAGGTPYRIEYGVRANTSAPLLWIEETGCWFAGPDGKPARGHRSHQQRTPRPRRAAPETVAQRSVDRRT